MHWGVFAISAQKLYIRTKTNRGKTFTVPEIRVTGPNGIIVAQTFCDIFFYEKKTSDINTMYINSFQVNCFFFNTEIKNVGKLETDIDV
jgi:hypothetical protein